MQITAESSSSGRIQLTADSSSGGWIRVAADSILWLTRVPAARYELRLHSTAGSSSDTWIRLKAESILPLTMSCNWLQFRWLDTCYSWLEFQRLDSTFDSIQQLTISYDCLEFQKLGTSYSWFHPVADNELRLILSCGWIESAGWTGLASDLYFNISSKFKDLFCKIHHFYGLFSTAWFQLPLIQALATASITLKKLEEASRL